MTRSRRTLEPGLALTITGGIERRGGSEDMVHCRLKVENVGDVRVVLRSAVLKVRPPLLEENNRGSWIREIRWGEPEEFETFDPGGVPGKVLNPRERYEEPAVLGMSTDLAEEAREPIQAQLRIIAEGDYCWSSVTTLVRVADGQTGHDNGAAERRR